MLAKEIPGLLALTSDVSGKNCCFTIYVISAAIKKLRVVTEILCLHISLRNQLHHSL